VDFALLGPLLVRRDQTAIPVATGKQRVLLAALLLAANQVLTIDELIDTVWDGRPPGSARVTLQGHVKRLRRALGDHTGSLILTRPAGYTITTTIDELDATRFNALLADGQHHAQREHWPSVADTMRTALALWRGQPLLDVPSETLTQAMLPRLTEMRVQALAWRIEADLRLGRHEQLIGELAELTDEHPLRERFHGQLMTALYRTGRQADALAAYHRLRRLLADELGVDPDPQSQRLYHQILAADPALLPSLPAAERAGAPPVPARRAACQRTRDRRLELTEQVGAHELHGLALMYLGDVEHDLGLAKTAARTWQQAHRILVRGSDTFARQAADRLARII
jgi:DNA-binding SARP family transcriptional activator